MNIRALFISIDEVTWALTVDSAAVFTVMPHLVQSHQEFKLQTILTVGWIPINLTFLLEALLSQGAGFNPQVGNRLSFAFPLRLSIIRLMFGAWILISIVIPNGYSVILTTLMT